jgi:hypothetical protein
MGKEQIHWEPDIKKSLDKANKIKDVNKELKNDADRRKIDGFNPGDLGIPTIKK